MKVKKWIVFLIIVVILNGCASKESKEFRKDKEVQEEIEEIIISKGEEYGLKLEPNTKKMNFALQPGVPLIDDRTLLIPVKTIGEPEFSFELRLNIEDPGDGTREIGDFEFWLSEDIGDFLVKHAFEEEYKSAFDALLEFGSHIYISDINVDSKTSGYFEDKQEEMKLIRAIATDYHAGKFANPKEYANLLEKYMLDEIKHSKKKIYLPSIYFTIDIPDYEDVDNQKLINDIKEYILHDKNLPRATYSFSSVDNEPVDGEEMYTSIDKLE
jgi:hypothetical protein